MALSTTMKCQDKDLTPRQAYDIQNPQNKTELRRMIERKFKRTDEIPCLIDLMSFDEDDHMSCGDNKSEG